MPGSASLSLDRISAVIITRDAEQTLATTLQSLSGFPEVVVYDNGSTDGTREAARRFENVRLVEGSFEGFGPTRNKAAEYASQDWILSVDADEHPDAQLIRAIGAAALDTPETVYALYRANRLMGREVRVGGWGGDWQKRLYNRTRVAFSRAPVHESLATGPEVRVRRLEGRLLHDAARDPGDFLLKVHRYSGLRAATQKPLHPALIVPRAAWAFLRSYVLRLGFTAGWRGLAIAWSDANGVFYKYLRAWVRRGESGTE